MVVENWKKDLDICDSSDDDLDNNTLIKYQSRNREQHMSR